MAKTGLILFLVAVAYYTTTQTVAQECPCQTCAKVEFECHEIQLTNVPSGCNCYRQMCPILYSCKGSCFTSSIPTSKYIATKPPVGNPFWQASPCSHCIATSYERVTVPYHCECSCQCGNEGCTCIQYDIDVTFYSAKTCSCRDCYYGPIPEPIPADDVAAPSA